MKKKSYSLVDTIQGLGREVASRQYFPDKIFELDGLSFEDFRARYEQMQRLMYDCPECVDREFGVEILMYVIWETSEERDSSEHVKLKVQQLQSFLHDGIHVPWSLAPTTRTSLWSHYFLHHGVAPIAEVM